MWELLMSVIAGWAALVLIIQDLRDRLISLWPMAIIFGSGLICISIAKEWQSVRHTGLNIFLTICITLSVILFFKLKGKTKVMDHLLGWGDVLVLIALSPWFEPICFGIYYSLVVSLSLLFHLLQRRIKPESDPQTIPLAAYLCQGFCLYLVLNVLLPEFCK